VSSLIGFALNGLDLFLMSTDRRCPIGQADESTLQSTLLGVTAAKLVARSDEVTGLVPMRLLKRSRIRAE
jgi:hypothetical protein